MTKLFDDLRHSRLFAETVAQLILLIFLLLTFPYKSLNDVFNAVAIAVWTAVLVSYLPIVGKGMRARYPSEGERLATGICAGGIVVLLSSSSQLYALNFEGQWIYSTAIIPIIRYIVPAGGIAHEMAARSIEGRVPTETSIRIGVIVGCGVLFALTLLLIPTWGALK